MTDTTTGPEMFDIYRLTTMAETCDASGECAGGRFLLDVQSNTRDVWDNTSEDEHDLGMFDDAGLLHEIADSAVPIYTADVWATFVDLQAWDEDVSALAPEENVMHTLACYALYQIADRLVRALVEAWAEATDDDTTDGE